MPLALGTIDLGRLRLRPGDTWTQAVEVELEPFVFGGQRYEARPSPVSVELRIARASGATVLDLQLAARLSGPCMRCLGHAEVEVRASVRELHDPAAPPADELRSEYVAEEQLALGTWVRDAVALALPAQILCRPDCAGLCSVCGRDLNVEPHDHVELEADPRWAALEALRDAL
ncbi:MAG TPA: DUF177 domain-containing protein [Gaiellaceae bacterium]|nr:DUF177 domain-containing protein [Gaiellaceae bacterium]